MAPKGKDAAPPAKEAAAPDAAELKYPEWSDELLAAEPFALDAPFEDPDGNVLPSDLFAGRLAWRRPSEFLAEQLGDEVGTHGKQNQGEHALE